MALKNFFTDQSLNRAFPTNLPGTMEGWEMSDRVREVEVASSVSSATEILPSTPVAIDSTSGEMTKVVPCSAEVTTPYGVLIYKTKNFVMRNLNGQRIGTVARDGAIMNVAVKTTITAGAAVYWDPTDGLYTSSSSSTIKIGMALETISTAVATGKIVKIEIQTPRV